MTVSDCPGVSRDRRHIKSQVIRYTIVRSIDDRE